MRRFDEDGVEWLAWISGKSAAGTGEYGLGMIVAVHFAPAAAPAPPRFEALLPRGRFMTLHDVELIALRRDATPIVVGDKRTGGDRL